MTLRFRGVGFTWGLSGADLEHDHSKETVLKRAFKWIWSRSGVSRFASARNPGCPNPTPTHGKSIPKAWFTAPGFLGNDSFLSRVGFSLATFD